MTAEHPKIFPALEMDGRERIFRGEGVELSGCAVRMYVAWTGENASETIAVACRPRA
jgi:hypothetical protein